MRGIRTDSMSSPGDIHFSAEVPDGVLEECVAKLKEYGIGCNYYNMSLFSRHKNNRGIQLWDNPQSLLQKLAKPKSEPKQDDAVIEESVQDEEQQQQLTIAKVKAELPFKLEIPEPKPRISKNNSWKKSDLAKRILFYLRNDMDLDNLKKEISELIEKAVSTYNPKILADFFGQDAFNYCLSTKELNKLTASVKDDVDADIHEYYTVFFISCYLPLALYYACAKGCLPVAKYFFETQQFKGSFQTNLSNLQKHLDTKEKLDGTLLPLAVRSGIIDLVQYIYEHTDATVETCIGSPTEETALMVAVSLGNEQMVSYLLEHGGNPNASSFSSNTTPLTAAITNKKSKLISLLIRAGAVVTQSEITLAIKQGLDLETIDLLLQQCINRENPFSPYLIAAVTSGDVALLRRLETHPLVMSFEQIISFNEQPIDERLVSAAAQSGSIEMVRYLMDVKKIDFKGIIQQEMQKEEAYFAEHADEKGFEHSREYAFHESTSLGRAAGTNVIFMRYLFEELNLKPSALMIKELCGRYAGNFKIVAYLLSLLEQSPHKAQELRTLAFDDDLKLDFLFSLFTSPLVVKGNPHGSHHWNYVDVFAALIKEKEKDLSAAEVVRAVQANPEALKGALFYYCTHDFAEHPERFAYLLTHMMQRSSSSPTVDIQNSSGESLAVFAYRQGCNSIVKLLLARRANPDLPDNEGQTLLNRVIMHDMSRGKEIGLVQEYVREITHSLRYASKETFFSPDQFKGLLALSKGQTHGISVKEILENCFTKSFHDPERQITSLFIRLSERNARQLVALLKDQSFLEQHPKFQAEAPGYLAKLEAIDESIMPAAAKRLKLDTFASISTAPSAQRSIFTAPKATEEPSKDAENTLKL
jgi:sulfur relay (sulfurtransferase) DsrC/TusE family protein